MYPMLFHLGQKLIQFFQLCLQLQSGLFFILVLPPNFCRYLPSPTPVTCFAHLIVFDLVTLTKFIV